MKILLINTCHYPRGGSETVYFNTSQILKDHGHSVAFFSAKDDRNKECEFEQYFIPNQNIRGLSTLKKIKNISGYLYNRVASKKLEQLLSHFKPDIAHVHLFYAVLSVSILKTLKKHNVPIVHTVHDYRLLCPVNTFLDNEGKICELCRDKHFYHCLNKKCSDGKFTQSFMVMLEAYFWKRLVNPVDYIDKFIFVSNFIQNIHISFNKQFIGKCSLLYNFANFSPRDNLLIKGDYFLFFGRLSIEKGIKTLLSVFSVSKDKRLVIAGTGPLKNYVEEIARETPNIEYLGFKTGEELESLIKNALFIILPSEWYENNPLSIIEAYSFGKPVIGSNVGGIPELIQDGKNGYLFKHGDKASLSDIIEKASNLSNFEYNQLSAASEKCARDNFDPERHYVELIKIFQNVLNKSSKRNGFLNN